MKMKDKKSILNMTFDSMNMSGKRSEEIIKELINYNTELEKKEEKRAMADKNLHEISPKNSKRGKWQYVLGALCVLAVAVSGVLIWQNTDINNKGNKTVAGSNVQGEEETTKEVLSENNTDSAGQTDKKDTVFYIEKGNDKILSSVIIPANSSKDLIYEVEQGNICMKVKKDYNYHLYSRQTDDGLEMMAVGVRKEGDTYYYVYSKQLKSSGDDTTAETRRTIDDTDDMTPDFIEVSFTAGEKYIDSREELIDELSAFYDTVNEFINDREPEASYKQVDIEGELSEGRFEYEVLQEAEAAYITCGVVDPIDFRLEGYFNYVDGEIGK